MIVSISSRIFLLLIFDGWIVIFVVVIVFGWALIGVLTPEVIFLSLVEIELSWIFFLIFVVGGFVVLEGMVFRLLFLSIVAIVIFIVVAIVVVFGLLLLIFVGVGWFFIWLWFAVLFVLVVLGLWPSVVALVIVFFFFAGSVFVGGLHCILFHSVAIEIVIWLDRIFWWLLILVSEFVQASAMWDCFIWLILCVIAASWCIWWSIFEMGIIFYWGFCSPLFIVAAAIGIVFKLGVCHWHVIIHTGFWVLVGAAAGF